MVWPSRARDSCSSRRRSPRRAEAMTRAPSRANSAAVSRPIPLEAPTTRTTWFSTVTGILIHYDTPRPAGHGFPPSQGVDGCTASSGTGARRRNPRNGRRPRTFGPRRARTRRDGPPYQTEVPAQRGALFRERAHLLPSSSSGSVYWRRSQLAREDVSVQEVVAELPFRIVFRRQFDELPQPFVPRPDLGGGQSEQLAPVRARLKCARDFPCPDRASVVLC